MVLNSLAVKARLQALIWDKYGKSVTFKSKSHPTYNNRGELTGGTVSSSTVTAVPYSVLDPQRTFEPFGNLVQGEIVMALPHSIEPKLEDGFTIDSVDYTVVDIQKNYFPENVGTIVRLSRDS